jgi:stearoyl-CoA desaturase (delta-9 desaturase)
MENTQIQNGEPKILIKARFVLLHIGTASIFFFPFEKPLLALCLALFALRMFGMEAGYHRYFSHRCYKVSRITQFVLAFIASSAGHRGVLWWAAHHRRHHRHTETAMDPHSPIACGKWYAFYCWYFDDKNLNTDLNDVRDLAKYPELLFLNRHHYLPLVFLLALTFCLGHSGVLGSDISGLAALSWGFFLSGFLVLYLPSLVNLVCHTKNSALSYRRFETPDESVNNWLLGLLTFGAGFHNNHHKFPFSPRSGFSWYEIDITYLALLLLRKLNIIKWIRPMPKIALFVSKAENSQK